ncbi:MAG: hypothetical protein AB2L07_01845 [Thermoanaerobaculaceae bacterium]
MGDKGQDQYVDSLWRILSAERLAPYSLDGRRPPLDALALYAWNMALCEALYPALHALEVAVRNSVHTAFSKGLGANWYENLERPELERVAAAKASLAEEGKSIEVSRVIAQLPLGFWTGLLTKRYEQRLWPRFMQSAFPLMPRSQRTRHVVHGRLDDLRNLRNRVFHHEPVWHWKDLPDKHHQLWEVTGWTNQELAELVAFVDRFPEVHRAGWQPYRELLDQFLQARH